MICSLILFTGAKALDKRTPLRSKGPESRKGSLNLTFRTLIAFALIERNEIREPSSTSTRSTRSVDMTQDNLDILRVHGIVQAFFVDILNEKHEVNFWLERAICVFCGAFDASIHRVDKDPQTGIPEDYRRLLIHGQRLLTHLDRFEKRFPDLKSAREELESRVNSIENRIDQLNKRINEAASQGSADVIVSVFERTNSLSESETSPSNRSLVEYSVDDGTETIESPSVYSPTEHGPYHWHIPMVYPPGANEWETKTVTPQLTAAEIFESMSMPDDDETIRKVLGLEHRTIRKQAGRRYRDRAGSWRAAPHDPRVTLSRETARGVIGRPTIQRQDGPSSSNDSGPTVQSEAEISLSQINRGSPKPPSGFMALIQPESPPSRPKFIAGRPSYADARAEEVYNEEYPVTPTFSYPPPASQLAAATIMRLKGADRAVSSGSLTPVKIPSPSAAPQIDSENKSPLSDPHQALGIPEDNLAGSLPSSTLSAEPPPRRPSGPTTRPSSVPLSRSARSSPSHSSGPFAPPPIAIAVNTSSSLHSIPSTSAHHLRPHRLSTQSLGEYNDYSPRTASTSRIAPGHNLSYPNTVPIAPRPFGMSDPPAPWVASFPPNLHPQGYSSQPMSRDPSHQSNSSLGSHRSLPQVRDSSRSSSNQALSWSSASQIMQQPRSRRPSFVETEPSPRLGPLELDPVVTSYQLYKETRESRSATPRHISRGRKRGESTPSAARFLTSGSRPRFLSRIRSFRTRSGSRIPLRSSSVAEGSGGGATGQGDGYGSSLETSPPRRSKTGDETMPSGSRSGGFKVDKSTVVGFGSPPAQAAATIAEVRRKSPRIGSTSPLAGQPSSPKRGSNASPPSPKGSRPPGVGLGIQDRAP